MRNVELKAIINDLNKLKKFIEVMNLGEAKIIHQQDTFFNSSTGRLKMRKFQDDNGELIFYERSNTEGPKLSSYDKMALGNNEFKNLYLILGRSLGKSGEVKKVRHLYVLEQTRIHLDYVEDLGNFIELEVVLKPDQSTEQGQMIALSIMKKLDINSEDLISCSYMDLIRKKRNSPLSGQKLGGIGKDAVTIFKKHQERAEIGHSSSQE